MAGLGQSGITRDSCRCWGFHFPPSLLRESQPFVIAKYNYFGIIIPFLVLAVSYLAFLQLKPNVPTQSLASVGIVRSWIFIVHPQVFRCYAEHDCQGIAFCLRCRRKLISSWEKCSYTVTTRSCWTGQKGWTVLERQLWRWRTLTRMGCS